MKTNYWPRFKWNDKEWNIITLNFVIDWGGRQIEIEAQEKEEVGGSVRDFIYYYLKDECIIRKRTEAEKQKEIGPYVNIEQPLFKMLKSIFDYFEENKEKKL